MIAPAGPPDEADERPAVARPAGTNVATTWLGLRPPWTIVNASVNGAALPVASALLARLGLRPMRSPARVPEVPWAVEVAADEERPASERRVRSA